MHKDIEYIHQANKLIESQSTGNLTTFAEKLSISKENLQEMLQLMMDLHAPIVFDETINSFVYKEPGELRIGFINREQSTD